MISRFPTLSSVEAFCNPFPNAGRVIQALVLLLGFAAVAGEAPPGRVFFSESFDDADLPKRDWYDGTAFRIVGGSRAGKGCIEYE